MRIFAVKAFRRFQRREKITDAMLCAAIDDAVAGLIGAELGGEVIKQRVARPGQGKRGGFRTLVAFRSGERAVFLYGFAKSEQENIRPDQLAELKLYAARWLGLDEDALKRALAAEDLKEVFGDNQATSKA